MSGLRKSLGWVIALVLIAALAVPKLLTETDPGKAQGATPDKSENRPLVRYQVLVPELLEERLSTTGTLRAAEQVDLVSEITGKVEEIFFREGRRVAVGDLLLKIDDTELAANRTRVVYQLELARQREKRQEQLLREGVTSQQDYDRALSERNVLDAELQVIDARLVKTEIRAPFSGVIGLRLVSPGSFLTPQTRIATLQSVATMNVDFSLPEKYVGIVQPGHEIQFRVKSSEEPFTGEITALEPSIDAATRSLTVRARCDNRSGLLWPGAFADVEIAVRRIEEALTVPSIAVIPELGGKKVFVLEDGRAMPRVVETGIRTTDKVQVLNGLDAGDKVIVSGIERLRSGSEVEVIEDRREDDEAS